MAVATRTLLQICEEVARNLGALEQGTITTVTTASAILPYPFKTALTDADPNKYVGDELYWTSGQFTPLAIQIITYTPSTGAVVPDYAWTDGGTDPTTFDIFKKGLRIADIKQAVNAALRQMRYITTVPITLLPDGDMELIDAAEWVKVTNATVAKTTASGSVYPIGNVFRGLQSLSITHDASGILGGAQSSAIRCKAGDQFYLQAMARCSAGPDIATLMAVDNSTGTTYVSIDTEAWTGTGWGILAFTFDAPDSTYGIIRVRLNSDSPLQPATTYWDDVMLLPLGAYEVPLPSWITNPNQVRHLLTGSVSTDSSFSTITTIRENLWQVIYDGSHPDNPYKLHLDFPITGPLWMEASKPYPALSADTDATSCDREWIELAATVELLDKLVNRAPGEETKAWKIEYTRKLLELKLMSARKGSQPIIEYGVVR